jgi:regulator of sigma E protease
LRFFLKGKNAISIRVKYILFYFSLHSIMSIPTILQFILAFSVIIIVHEFGHFIAARLCNIPVKEFGLGLPPRMVKLFTWQGTDFTLNWLPLGGFVKPAGEDDATIMDGLANAPHRHRLFVLAAGSGMNLIFGFLVLVVMFMTAWPTDSATIQVADVQAGSPAEAGGLLAGDQFVSVNGIAIESSETLTNLVKESANVPLEVVVLRGSETVNLSLTPIYLLDANGNPEQRARLGVGLQYSPIYTHYSIFESIGRAASELGQQIMALPRFLIGLVSRTLSPQEARVVGPVGIYQIYDDTAQSVQQTGNWWPILYLMVGINISIGLANLLPLPALDGGRILFVVVDWFLRLFRIKRIPTHLEAYVHAAGMLILLSLMVLIAINDFRNPINLP